MTPGVYTITLTVTDDHKSAQAIYRYVVVYDPAAGFVTGGGWIHSPPGAYAANPALEGRALFGFVARYQTGATTPDGHTNFRFQLAGLSFSGTTYQWLVIAGATAKFKGSGTINGEGNYGFMLSAVDGDLTSSVDADRFRIKLWDKDSEDEFVVYDNQMDDPDDADAATTLGGGSIRIQTGSAKAAHEKHDRVPTAFSLFQNQPNPFNPTTRIEFDLARDGHVSLKVYDVAGRLVRTLIDDSLSRGHYAGHRAAVWDGLTQSGQRATSGIYLYRLLGPDFAATRKMLLLK